MVRGSLTPYGGRFLVGRYVGWLIEPYRLCQCHFEVLQCVRKLLIVGAPIILFTQGSAGQVGFGLAVCAASIPLFVYFTPYNDPADNRLELLCQTQIFAVLLAEAMARMDPNLVSASSAPPPLPKPPNTRIPPYPACARCGQSESMGPLLGALLLLPISVFCFGSLVSKDCILQTPAKVRAAGVSLRGKLKQVRTRRRRIKSRTARFRAKAPPVEARAASLAGPCADSKAEEGGEPAVGALEPEPEPTTSPTVRGPSLEVTEPEAPLTQPKGERWRAGLAALQQNAALYRAQATIRMFLDTSYTPGIDDSPEWTINPVLVAQMRGLNRQPTAAEASGGAPRSPRRWRLLKEGALAKLQLNLGEQRSVESNTLRDKRCGRLRMWTTASYRVVL